MQTLEFDNLSKIVYHLLGWFGYYDIIIIFCDVWDSNHIFHNFSGKTNNDSRLQYFKGQTKSKESLQFEETCCLEFLHQLLNTSRYSGTAEPGWQVLLAHQLTLSQPREADYAHRNTIHSPDFQTFYHPWYSCLVLLHIGSKKTNFDPSKLLLRGPNYFGQV